MPDLSTQRLECMFFSVVSVPHKRKRFEFSKKNLFLENLQRLRLGLTILSYVLNFFAEKREISRARKQMAHKCIIVLCFY